MADGFERVERLEKVLSKTSAFIKGVTTFLYDQIADPTLTEIVESTKSILVHNYNCLQVDKERVDKIRRQAESAAPVIVTPETTPKERKSSLEPITVKRRDLSETIDLITLCYLDSDIEPIIKNLTSEEIARIKLYFYKKIIELKKEIKESILDDPTKPITKYQEEIDKYYLIMEFLNDFTKPKEEVNKVEEEQPYSNIVFAQHRNTTYIAEDIEEFIERSKEIKNIIDKIVDGYFLKTKDTKPIEGYQEKLFEYKHPNGIRILYVVSSNVIVICSLFMKDKQKSARIAGRYEESIERYYNVINYIEESFTNPDFHIEQAELLGEIYSLIDGPSLSKKVGDE